MTLATDSPFHCARRCGGFTLLELLVAMLAASVLLAGLSSALFLSIQATQPDVGGHDSTLRGSQALVDLSSELRFAKAFTLRTDKAVEFAVADRSGEGDDETIRWQWSGAAGDPLTRRYNGGAVVDIVDNVHEFQLSYNVKSLTTFEESSGEVVSDEMMFANFEGWQGITPSYVPHSLGTATWAAEYFMVSGLPQDLSSMSITRALVRLKKNGSGNVQVAIHKAVGGGNIEPQPVAIGSPASVSVATLPSSFDWVEFSFADVTLGELQEEFVIVIKATSDNAAYVEKLFSTSAPADTPTMLTTSNAGSTWGPSPSSRKWYDIQFRVWGTYTTLTESETSVTRYFVVSSDIAAQVGSATSHRVAAATEILNRPEVAQP